MRKRQLKVKSVLSKWAIVSLCSGDWPRVIAEEFFRLSMEKVSPRRSGNETFWWTKAGWQGFWWVLGVHDEQAECWSMSFQLHRARGSSVRATRPASLFRVAPLTPLDPRSVSTTSCKLDALPACLLTHFLSGVRLGFFKFTLEVL